MEGSITNRLAHMLDWTKHHLALMFVYVHHIHKQSLLLSVLGYWPNDCEDSNTSVRSLTPVIRRESCGLRPGALAGKENPAAYVGRQAFYRWAACAPQLHKLCVILDAEIWFRCLLTVPKWRGHHSLLSKLCNCHSVPHRMKWSEPMGHPSAGSHMQIIVILLYTWLPTFEPFREVYWQHSRGLEAHST